MSYSLAKQFYTDIDKVAQKQAGQFVDAAHITIFNALLTEAKSKHPNDTVLQALPQAEGDVRYSDMLARAGLLMQILKDVDAGPHLGIL